MGFIHHEVVTSLASLSTPVYVLLVASIVVALLLYRAVQRPLLDSQAPKFIEQDHDIFAAWEFFRKRWDFYLRSSKDRARSFSFWIGRYPMIGLSGESARKMFFEHKSLSVNEGYSLFFGVMPASKVTDKNGEDISDKHAYESFLNKSVQKMLAREKMRSYLPAMIEEVEQTYSRLAKKSKRIVDPFDDIYCMSYSLAMLVFGCAEICRKPKLLYEMFQIYENFKYTFTPTMIVFPWLPTMAMFRKVKLLFRLWWVLSGTIQKRQKMGNRENDVCQAMLDHGDSTSNIIGVILTLLFAGSQQMGANAAWVFIFLACNPEWKAKAYREVIEVASRYYPDPDMPLPEKLRWLPLEAWETEFPILDLCFKDSMRLNTTFACFRRNMSTAPIPISADGKEVVPSGWYACYHIADLHLNPELFPDPERWDPGRYERGEDKKEQTGFLGFGAGRNMCMGRKFAQLEQVVVTAFFLASFDFDLVNGKGDTVHNQPTRDFNRFDQSKPLEPVFLRYEPVDTLQTD